MAGPWPTTTPDIPTGNMDNDADSLTAARDDILDLTNRFNLVLASINAGDTPLTDNNSGALMPKVAPFTDGQVPILAGGDGSLARSGYPITVSNALPNGNLAITDAIKAYIATQGIGAPNELTAQPYAFGLQLVFPHGLGRQPYTLNFIMNNISGGVSDTFPANARVNIGNSAALIESPTDLGFSSYSDNTNVYMNIADQGIPNTTNIGNVGAFNIGDWEIIPQVT